MFCQQCREKYVTRNVRKKTSRATATTKHKADSRWSGTTGIRKTALARDCNACAVCSLIGRGYPSESHQVDHIAPRHARPDLRWTLDNLQTLCLAHHSQKTWREERYGRVVDWNVLRNRRIITGEPHLINRSYELGLLTDVEIWDLGKTELDQRAVSLATMQARVKQLQEDDGCESVTFVMHDETAAFNCAKKVRGWLLHLR